MPDYSDERKIMRKLARNLSDLQASPLLSADTRFSSKLFEMELATLGMIKTLGGGGSKAKESKAS